MRNPAFFAYKGKNKGADQLCGNHAAAQRLCFRYIDGTIPLLPHSKISSVSPSSVAVQLYHVYLQYCHFGVSPDSDLCRTWL